MQSTAINKKYTYNRRKQILLRITSLLLLLSVLSSYNLQAQIDAPSTFLRVKLKGQTAFTGMLLSETIDSIKLQIKNDTIVNLHRSDIRYSYKVQDGIYKDGKYYPYVFDYDKGFLNQSAFGIEKGAVYFSNTMLFWNELSAGLSDNLSLRVGFDVYGLAQKITDETNEYYEPSILIAPKRSFSVIEDKWQIALSPAIINLPDDDGFLDFGLLFFNNTLGNKNRSFSIGLGTQIFGEGGPLVNSYFTFSAHLRLNPSLVLITENWIVSSEDYNGTLFGDIYRFSSLGIKTLGKTFNWSVVLLRLKEDGSSFTVHFPIIGVSFPISNGGRWRS